MKKLTLILFVAVLAVSFMLTAAPSTVLAKSYVFKYANTQSDSHPRSQSMVFFKNMLEKASNGRISVELYFFGLFAQNP